MMVLGRMMHLGFTAFLTPPSSGGHPLRLLLAHNFENVEDCRPIVATCETKTKSQEKPQPGRSMRHLSRRR